MFILTHFIRKKLKVNGRERPLIHCIMAMTTKRTIIGLKLQLVIHLFPSLSMNLEDSKHRISIYL